MRGLKIGHFTEAVRGTGVSVFLFDKPAVGAYWICGSAPATHELNVLDPETNVNIINGLAFLGGSAFGLSAVHGVMRWLKEHEQGWSTTHGVVPIVPAAAIYDLGVNESLPPTEQEAYQACSVATEQSIEVGRVGAGTGASIGKLAHSAAHMSGGIGRAEIQLPNGVTVLAYAVVNSVGDVRDATGKIIAGATLENGKFADCSARLLSGEEEKHLGSSNTTLVAVFTNAAFSKIELKRIAKMAVAGMGRAISPIFTRYDGDIIFCVSVGDKTASELMIGEAAAEMTRQAIVNAVQDSVVL